MFYALAAGRIDSRGYEVEHVLQDIETLNRAALDGVYEVTSVLGGPLLPSRTS